VNVVEQDARGIRAVWIVAGGAAGFLYGIVLMYLPERRIVCFMATEAQGGLLFHQEIDAHCRRVRIVAFHAAVRHRIVVEFIGCNPLAQLLVAFHAESTAGADQVHLVLGTVRIMA